MESTFIPQNPHAHCYICGESDPEKLDKVCHHCGRAICRQHQSTDLLFESVLYNPEFTKLDLQGVTDFKAIHCKECAQQIHWMRTPLGMLGRLLLFPRFYARCYVGKKHRPALPTMPTVSRVLIAEFLSGHMTLDATGKCQSPKVETAKGIVKVAFRFTEQDWKRFKRYCLKYGVKASDPTFMYHAGFALLQDTDNLGLNERSEASPLDEANQKDKAKVVQGGTLAFVGRICDQPFFTEAVAKQPNTWAPACSYTIKRADEKKFPLPIQIIPTIAPNGTQQTLQLTIQVLPDNSTFTTYDSICLNRITLRAPATLQKVTWVLPPAQFAADATPAPDATIPITWRNLEDLKKDEAKVISVSFAEKLQPNMVLHGSITATFTGALSGVKGVKLFYPWGEPQRNQVRAALRTRVVVGFTLHLDKLRYQSLYTSAHEHKFLGITPNYRFINTLTRHLSKEYYVRRTVESPPQTTLAGGHLRRNLWDIAGRAYVSLHPLDFHLILTGEENPVERSESRMNVNITTKAVVPHETIREEAEVLCDRLFALIARTVNESRDK